jgi:hypothetical protein
MDDGMRETPWLDCPSRCFPFRRREAHVHLFFFSMFDDGEMSSCQLSSAAIRTAVLWDVGVGPRLMTTLMPAVRSVLDAGTHHAHAKEPLRGLEVRPMKAERDALQQRRQRQPRGIFGPDAVQCSSTPTSDSISIAYWFPVAS